jgi:hypothetical protein
VEVACKLWSSKLSCPAEIGRGNMVRGLPEIKEVDKLYDGCLISKQRRNPFPTKANYRASESLGGKTLFLLMVEDMSRYMWAILL